MDSVLIVVLNWNNMADTEACLASLTDQTYPNFRICLIDNDSTELNTDNRLNELTISYGKKLHIIRNSINRGFAGGVNTGIRYGLENDYDYIALFNNDAVAEPDWLNKLLEASVREGSSLTTGLLLHEEGKTIDSTGDWYSIWGLPFPRARKQPRASAPDSGPVFGVSGGASLFRTSLFTDIGLFDEAFFAYYEDVDVSFRAKLAGHSAYFEKSAVAYHKQGATSSKIPGFAAKQTLKNLPMIYMKDVPAGLLIPIGIRFWPSYSAITLKAILSVNFLPALTGYLQGVWLFWVHALPQRFNIQRQKKISTQELRASLWPDLPPDQTGLRRLLGRK